MSDYWRNLKLGEEIKVGDRCFGKNNEWFIISDLNLEYQRHITEFCYPLQRKADCVPPIENGKNRYGVDVSYFRDIINRELNRGLENFKPSELARVFARLSVTADSQVIFENEFQSRRQSISTANEVLIPKELTAENGAKAIFMGEFNISQEHECNECEELGHDDTEEMLECEMCEGRGSFNQKIPVPWDMIKDIYALAVKRLAK